METMTIGKANVNVPQGGTFAGINTGLVTYTTRRGDFSSNLLSCVPAAARNAAKVLGVDLPESQILTAKHHEIEEGGKDNTKRTKYTTGTNPNTFFPALNSASGNVHFRPLKNWSYRGAQMTLKALVAQLRERGISTGVVITRSPNHAWALHVTPERAYIVDNEAWGASRCSRWNGRNIVGFFEVVLGKADYEPIEQLENVVDQPKHARVLQTDRITVLVPNPKKVYSKAWYRFGLYSANMTVANFIAAGGTMSDIRFDRERNYISLSRG